MIENFIYAGISNVRLSDNQYDLSNDVRLERTYAHLMSPCLMAFKPADAGKPHPGPWRTAKGGYSYDITVQLQVPLAQDLPGRMSPKETVWWIAALLRLINYPRLMVPVISDHQFSLAGTSQAEPTLEPFEIEPRIILPVGLEDGELTRANLEWVKGVWEKGAELIRKHPKLHTAIRAYDYSTIHGNNASSMLAVWGGLESIFSTNHSELRHRISANLATYLEEAGKKRLTFYKKMLTLYDARSSAAHTATDVGQEALHESIIIMRNALVRILNSGVIPSKEMLEEELFSPSGFDD